MPPGWHASGVAGKKELSIVRLKFFAIPALDPHEAESELNEFLAEHRVLRLDRELITERTGSFWSVVVEFASEPPAAKGKKPRIDYKEVLSPRDFEIYAALRDLRREQSDKEGIPVYALFSNAQLAEMVEGNIQTLQEMAKIEGIGSIHG